MDALYAGTARDDHRRIAEPPRQAGPDISESAALILVWRATLIRQDQNALYILHPLRRFDPEKVERDQQLGQSGLGQG
jgi:hypothetical protein